jgi:SAM-dependent methyltransferase
MGGDGFGDRGAKIHYERFLAERYLWMAGGFDPNCRRNRDFFAGHAIVPASTRVAVDLGAGCGFQSIPLGRAGFHVVSVDFCRPLLFELGQRAGGLAIDIAESDILEFAAWASRRPELIVCMGDTLTHLPDMAAVSGLIRQCHAELVPGGRLVLSFRDYTAGPGGSVEVIPVRRDEDRIFLCRLEYGEADVDVTDILFSRESGHWERTAGSYTKIRIAPDVLAGILASEGFALERVTEAGAGPITVIARRMA